MTDLNELLRDFKDKRLAYKEINRAAHEALMDGIVAEVSLTTALMRSITASSDAAHARLDALSADIEALKEKRGPGRPPKAEAA